VLVLDHGAHVVARRRATVWNVWGAETLIRIRAESFRPYDRLVFFFLVDLVVRRLLRVLVGSSSVGALEVENAVLRHELAHAARGDAALSLVCFLVGALAPVIPWLGSSLQIDNTDTYAWTAKDDHGAITVAANWIPGQNPANGPNAALPGGHTPWRTHCRQP